MAKKEKKNAVQNVEIVNVEQDFPVKINGLLHALFVEGESEKKNERKIVVPPSYKFTLTPTHICFFSLKTPKLRRSRVRTKAMEVGGLDSKGREFKNAEEMWREQAGDPSKKCDWYKHGVGYWEGVEASVNGVLGGYAQVNEPDIEGSQAFLNTLLSERFPNSDHLAALGISTLSLFLSGFVCFYVCFKFENF